MSTATHIPLIGPPTGSPEWYAERFHHLLASEAAKACGVSEYGQPLDVYLEKRGLVPPFEGNDFTARGHRAEPFIAQEFEIFSGLKIETGLPMCFHPDTPHIGATPDGRIDRRRGVEFKLCNWRRASALGDEGTDQIFEDWVMQTQQQMYVMGWDVCEVFVMQDIHQYRHFRVDRDDTLISRMVEIETELWRKIEAGERPDPDFKHPLALDLVKKMHGVELGEEIVLPDDVCRRWEHAVSLKESIKALEGELDAIKAEVIFAMGTAEFARVPFTGREIVRGQVAPLYWTDADIETARAKLGEVKRKGYTVLGDRKAK